MLKHIQRSILGLVILLLMAVSFPQPAISGKNTAQFTIGKGDYLSRIAVKFGVTVSELRRTNNLKSDKIYVGQRIKIDQPFHRKKSRDLNWSRPCRNPGRVIREFGPYKENNVIMPRTGTDIALKTGSWITLPEHGVVRYIGHMDGFGLLMIIEHGAGYSTVLSPFDPKSISVEVDQALVRGSRLGKTGQPEEGDQAYLHVELRKNDKAIKPDKLLR